jgi:hypothetical protein
MVPNGCRHGYGIVAHDLACDAEVGWHRHRMIELRRASGVLGPAELQASDLMGELDRRICAVIAHSRWLASRLKEAEVELAGVYERLDACSCTGEAEA